jgi:hypothetical protein
MDIDALVDPFIMHKESNHILDIENSKPNINIHNNLYLPSATPHEPNPLQLNVVSDYVPDTMSTSDTPVYRHKRRMVDKFKGVVSIMEEVVSSHFAHHNDSNSTSKAHQHSGSDPTMPHDDDSDWLDDTALSVLSTADLENLMDMFVMRVVCSYITTQSLYCVNPIY